MHNCKVATQDLAPTPGKQGGHVPGLPVPDGALISNNDDDSFISDTESEGGFVVTTLMTQVQRYISQMKELKDLTLPLMVKAIASCNKVMTQLIG
jgi:hypothetical protein